MLRYIPDELVYLAFAVCDGGVQREDVIFYSYSNSAGDRGMHAQSLAYDHVEIRERI